MTTRDALKCWSTSEDWDDKTNDAIVTISPAVAQRWLTFRKTFEQLKPEDPHRVGLVSFDFIPDFMSLESTVIDDKDSMPCYQRSGEVLSFRDFPGMGHVIGIEEPGAFPRYHRQEVFPSTIRVRLSGIAWETRASHGEADITTAEIAWKTLEEII